ncbi:AlpA family phage regulatory protein [Rhizobium leguminosarum bv. viciae]|nr:AlpA family phage regulatory protein [Rhizobium leguminosarum bv. viciae]
MAKPPSIPESSRTISNPHGVCASQEGGEPAPHCGTEHGLAAENAIGPRGAKAPGQSNLSAENRAPLSASGDAEPIRPPRPNAGAIEVPHKHEAAVPCSPSRRGGSTGANQETSDAAERERERRTHDAKRSRRRVPDKRRLIARDPRGFFSMKETCEITSLSRGTITRMVERETFPEYRPLTDDPNGRKGFRVSEVLKWLADRG